MRTISLIFSYLLIVIGFASWFLVPNLFSENNEIPLGDIKGFVVDKQNNIYLGSGFYERVQVYNENGEFIRNWKVESLGGTYSIDISANDNILITSARGREQIEYDKNGKVLSKNEIDILKYQNDFKDKKTFITENGTAYELKGNWVSKLVKKNPEKTIIKQSIFLQIIKGPTNSWVLGLIGIICVNLISWKKK